MRNTNKYYIKDAKINIAFATDSNFYKFTYIAIRSIIEHKTCNRKYNFIILTQCGLDDSCKNYIFSIRQYCNIDIIFKECDIFNECYSPNVLINNTTYLRLLLPTFIDYDKILYLDSDIIVNNCIEGLYDTNIDDYYVAGVLAPAYIVSPNAKQKAKSLSLKNIDNYINAGVLLLNCKKIRSDGLVNKLLSESKNRYPSADQDIINKVFVNKIKKIDFKYNVMTKYYNWTEDKYNGLFPIEEILNAFRQPTIIHYADRYKPWISPELPLSKIWIYGAQRLLPEHDNIIILQKIYHLMKIKFIYKYFNVKKNCVVYKLFNFVFLMKKYYKDNIINYYLFGLIKIYSKHSSTRIY